MAVDPHATPRYLQLLWGIESSGRRGPKPGRTITEIGKAAVAVADRDGLEAVSMKAVASSLGLTTMSLYRYVDSKDDLYAVMLDTAYGTPDPSVTARGGWRGRLERWTRAIAARRLDHPWTVMVPLKEPPAAPNTALWTECGLRAFQPTKLPAQQRFSSLLLLDGFVQQHIRQSLQLGFLSAGGSSQRGTDGYPENLFSLADPARYPLLLAGASEAMAPEDDDDFFETELTFGLHTILDGIAAQVERAGWLARRVVPTSSGQQQLQAAFQRAGVLGPGPGPAVDHCAAVNGRGLAAQAGPLAVGGGFPRPRFVGRTPSLLVPPHHGGPA